MSTDGLRGFRDDSSPPVGHERDLQHLVDRVASGRMSRREFVERAVVLGLAASTIGTFLAACGGTSGGTSSASPAAINTSVKPTEIKFLNWATYLAPANIKNFQQQTGIKITQTYFSTEDELLAKLKAGAVGWDVICPAEWMTPIMRKSGLLMPLDMSLIPNLKNAMASLQAPAYDDPAKQGDLKYSTPYQYGTAGIGYRKDLYAGTPTSWKALFPPAVDPYKGNIIMLDDPRQTPGAALMMLGHSLNTTDQGELDQATQTLITQKPYVRSYDQNNGQRFLVSGMPIIHANNGQAVLAMKKLGVDKVGFSLPAEGYSLWCDNLAVPKGAPSPYGAHLFMDFMLETTNQADLSRFSGYLSPDKQAMEMLNDPALNSTIPTAAQEKYGYFIQDLGAFGVNYENAWAKVKNA